MSQKSDKMVTRYFPSEPGEAMPSIRPSGDSLSPTTRLIIQIEGERRTSVTLQLGERILVGRSDEDSEMKPGLDFAPYGGENSGVSRNHAAFSYHDHSVYLEDLGSTNGTRINGMELTPNQPYHLRDGDELEFGRARVIVRFAH